MIEIQPHNHGVLIRVRTLPGARKSEIRGEQDGAIKVAVTQVAEKGKANKAVIGLLSKSLGISKTQFELVSGATNKNKRVLITNVTAAELRERIAAVVSDAKG